jgi:hypothetical protein
MTANQQFIQFLFLLLFLFFQIKNLTAQQTLKGTVLDHHLRIPLVGQILLSKTNNLC